MNTQARLHPSTEILDVAIIGAGFSGLGMGIRLKQAGISHFRIFDQGADVGGTWRDNTYPGCGCDIKSQLYSYSFEPYPDWSHVYSAQPEILEYMRHCAHKYGMYPFIQFNTLVNAATYHADHGLWSIRTAQGETFYAKNLVTAPGPFAAPADVQFKGLNRFKGQTVHTGQWDQNIDLTGKRVGLIGTGATAVQVAPAIVQHVAHLSVFQRTANWIMPRPDRAITDQEKRLNRNFPLAMKASRLGIYWFNELTAPFLVLKYDAFKSHPEKLARSYLARKVKDPVLKAKLTPDYKFGCKRVLVSSDWYKTVQRENVNLITDGIDTFTAKGVKTSDGTEHALDVVIFATGYQVRSTGAPFPIVGLNGQLLAEKWKDGAEAYNGITTHGFPNLYFLVGPFTGPGHTSVIAYAEAQIDYVIQAIKLREQKKLKAIEVKPDVEQRFVQLMDRLSEHTVWKSGCASWYLSPNGRNNTLYPGFNAEYRLRIMRFNPADYQLTADQGEVVAAGLTDHLRTTWFAIKR
ncbi:MAG: NAD(P)/FAD-dependent oxidoreductase [Pseudomonadota bacterium]|nr:NAD(P)/FAD-dependent oxidoreductase [Pseudomonadota bacterium]